VAPPTGIPVPAATTALRERFLELTTDVAAAVDFDGRLVGANPAFTRVGGSGVGEQAGAHARELLHPDDREALIALWADLVGGVRDTVAIEVRLGPPEARRRFLLSLVADHEAAVVYLVGKDVHEPREAANRLGDAEARFRGAFDRSGIGMTITSLDGRYLRVNAAFARIVGRSIDELRGMAVADVSHPGDLDPDRSLIVELVANPGGIVEREKRYVRPDGSEVLVFLNVSAVAGEDGATQYLIAQMVDITQQRAAERALADSERRFRTLAAASPAGIFSAGFDGRMLYANDRLAEIYGIVASELDGNRWFDRVDPASRAALEAAARSVAAGNGPAAIDVRLAGGAGARWARVNLAAIPADAHGGGTFVGTVEDVTSEVEARAELATREAEFRMLAEHSGDALARHDREGRFLYASPATEAMLGYRPDEMVGRTLWDLGLVHPEDAGVARSLGGSVLTAEGATTTGSWRVVRPDGSIRWVETAVRSVPDHVGDAHQVVTVTRDVTERKDAEARLAHQARHDTLTGLPNRALFLDRLEQALRRSDRNGSRVAVLFVDLDRFKLINDSFGHAAGDRVLCDVAARLRPALRPADTIARFGGDELTVLCEDVDGEAGARAIARRIAALFEEPFLVEDGEAFLQASIGIAIAGDNTAPEDLIRDADAAMYRAKEGGRAAVEVFDEAMRRDARERVATESALRRAIARDELCIHVQPVVGLRDDRIHGFEALVRWQHPERGLVPPGDFIPLAEETGLIVPIGNFVVREVCRTLARWREEAGAPWVQCSVNLSVRHLQQPDLVETVATALERYGVRADRLVLEITESAVMENGSGTVETLEALKALGVRLALDDFGTGYSSLAHLHRFPLDVLKIDRSFTAALDEDHQGASIAGAIVSLAQALGLATVAEGIEDGAQLRQLERLGCTFGQGFHFSRPRPPHEFDAVLRDGGALTPAATPTAR
jgi:diguanylate cyclase (GGDEF)-like protein/PAS domain S-box-containing protein